MSRKSLQAQHTPETLRKAHKEFSDALTEMEALADAMVRLKIPEITVKVGQAEMNRAMEAVQRFAANTKRGITVAKRARGDFGREFEGPAPPKKSEKARAGKKAD